MSGASAGGPRPPVSAILAARDEAGTIEAVVRGTFAALPPASEVLVVDDGSADATAELAERAGARVVRRTAAGAHGKGLALRDGIAAARGEIAVFLDADGQDPPQDIPLLLAALAPGVDLVNGSKFLGTCKPGAISRLNRAGNRFMSALVNALFGLAITDSQSGFRAIRLERLRALALASREYEIETEVLLRGALAGWRMIEVPVTRDRRGAGSSGFKRVRNGLRILGLILAIRVRSFAR